MILINMNNRCFAITRKEVAGAFSMDYTPFAGFFLLNIFLLELMFSSFGLMISYPYVSLNKKIFKGRKISREEGYRSQLFCFSCV